MSQAQTKTAVETIVDAGLWEAVAEGVNSIATREEAAFEFDDDGLRVRVKDTANVAMITQTVPADEFEHYAVGGDVTIGVNTAKFEDLLDVANGDTVEFNLNAETRKFEFEVPGVEYELTGINPDSMGNSPVDVPPIKPEYDWAVDVDLPVELWERGTDVVDLAGSGHGTFVAPGGDDDRLLLEGAGDTDKSRVDLSDHDDFAWRSDAPNADGVPDTRVECVQSNEYMPEVVSVIDEDVVRFVTGTELPYHVFTERCDGRIDTKLLQAPRIVSD